MRAVVRQVRRASWVTPLSGNEMHCLEMKGLSGDAMAFGNSVRSLGIARSVVSYVSSGAGGKNAQITNLIQDGRTKAFNRMLQEAANNGNDGIVGVTSDIGPLGGLIEFMSYGAGVQKIQALDPNSTSTAGEPGTSTADVFSTTCTGEQYYCLSEAGFTPKSVVFGNEAYSAGIKGAFFGTLRTAVLSGEVKAYSNLFNQARRNALMKMKEDAFHRGCNFVSGVRMQAMRLPLIQEVTFYGTACVHPGLRMPASPDQVYTSAVPEEELWGLASVGRRPVAVLTGCSVYNLGIGRSITGNLQQIKGGEASRYAELTQLARESVTKQLKEQADRVKADEVVSVTIDIEEIRPGMIEFFAYGTAVVNDSKLQVPTKSLPPQVLMGERKKFVKPPFVKQRKLMDSSATGHAEAQSYLVTGMRSGFSSIVSFFRSIITYFIRILGYIFPFLNRLIRRG
eukprot:TRINITY_DN16771_c0_g1_i1.p1 TRINITY_DN16771_c0_g1~~TRINITY_DN16771_c0_g1_i1.p1  ORF type:complete len:453 (+),score=120.39 TRINITY_DN16771_c0_g1_i1:37-1395(+)